MRELAKKGKPAVASAPPGKPDLEKEIARLRAENQQLKQGAAAPPADVEAAEAQDADAEDAEHQAKIDDLESQMAVLRKLARESKDASLVNALLENLEKRADGVRAERRAGWSVPRLLDRHRARVAEREAREAKAVDRVEELAAEQARIAEDLSEARAHLQAKQEDLAAEQAEVFRLEEKLPKPQGTPAAAAGTEEADVDEEAKVAASIRRLAASKGGKWSGLLATMQAASSSSGGGPCSSRRLLLVKNVLFFHAKILF